MVWMVSDLPNWLEAFNKRMGMEDVPHLGRPLRAWVDWCLETGSSIPIDHPTAQQIFKWFESRSPADSLSLPDVFIGAFYFDAYFWPVHIPKAIGTQMLDGKDALPSMPLATKDRLFQFGDPFEDYKALWADCVDYGYGILDLQLGKRMLELTGGRVAFWERLLVSGDRKLRSSVEDLCKPIPGENAMQSSREACEMFLKAFLAKDHGLTEKDAANHFGHKLLLLFETVLQHSPNAVLAEASARFSSFPEVGDRYAGKPYDAAGLWNAYKVAQTVAAEVTRTFTNRNTRSQVATRF